MEAHYHTAAGAPLIIGGIPDDATMQTPYAITIPDGAEPAPGREHEDGNSRAGFGPAR